MKLVFTLAVLVLIAAPVSGYGEWTGEEGSDVCAVLEDLIATFEENLQRAADSNAAHPAYLEDQSGHLAALRNLRTMMDCDTAQEENVSQAYVLVGIEYLGPVSHDWKQHPVGEYQHQDRGTTIQHQNHVEYLKSSPGVTSSHSPRDIHLVFSWNDPPRVIRPGQEVAIRVDLDVKRASTGGFIVGYSAAVKYSSYNNMTVSRSPVEQHVGEGFLRFHSRRGLTDSTYGVFTHTVMDSRFWTPREGRRPEIEVITTSGNTGARAHTKYIYEWRE